jgi:signal transduction histidine kinase
MTYRGGMRTTDLLAGGPGGPAPGAGRGVDRRVDASVALLVGVVQLVGTFLAARHQPAHRPLDPVGVALLVAGPVALTVRRRAPVAVLFAVLAATLAYNLLGFPMGPIWAALIVAFFTAVLAGRRLAAWLALAAGYLSGAWLEPLVHRSARPSLVGAVALAAWLLLLLTIAETVRARRERALAAARSRDEETRRRASEERLRIARELHDVLAHHISLINVQAGVALHLMDERPEQARTALTAIKQASKDALGELRGVLDALRQVDEAAPRAPQAGLAQLDDLVAGARAAGLRVHAEVDGAPRPLPAGVDLAAFRIVQEALTNVTRHAGPATATVRVTYGDDDLTVQVDDDGHGSGGRAAGAAGAQRGDGGGNGIPGMRERAAALGGHLEAGPRPGGGFRVHARLPLESRR